MSEKFYKELFFFVFGIGIDGKTDDKMERCVNKAYLDMCRTLRYEDEYKISKRKKDFIQKTNERVIKAICDYPYVENVDKYDCEKPEYLEKEFDVWHWQLYKAIIDIYEEYKNIFKDKSFSIGNIQKWINMSIKYMRIMELDVIKRIPLKDIHIPIDDYILTAAEVNSGELIIDSFQVEGLGIKKKEYNIESWSGIVDYKNYFMYQKKVREKVKTNTSIEWESQAWIAEATNRSNSDKK